MNQECWHADRTPTFRVLVVSSVFSTALNPVHTLSSSPGGSVFSEVERRAHICLLSSYYHLLPLSHVFFTSSRIPPEQSSRKTKALGFKLKGLNSFMTLVSGVHDGPGTCDPVCVCQWKMKVFYLHHLVSNQSVFEAASW